MRISHSVGELALKGKGSIIKDRDDSVYNGAMGSGVDLELRTWKSTLYKEVLTSDFIVEKMCSEKNKLTLSLYVEL